MKLPNKRFSDYTLVEANLTNSELPITLKVFYTYEPEFPGSIKDGEYLSEYEPAGISIDDVSVLLPDSAEIFLAEYIRTYLIDS